VEMDFSAMTKLSSLSPATDILKNQQHTGYSVF
jgi:hypothetical protein